MAKENPSLFPEAEIETYKIDRIIKRDGRIVPFSKGRITESIYKAAVSAGGVDRELAESLAGKVIQMINGAYAPGRIPTVEEVQDLTEKVLVENGHFRTSKAYILYRQEHKRLREKKESQIVVEDSIPYKILWKTYAWNVDHNCDTIEKLNKTIRDGGLAQLVKDSESAYALEIKKVSEKLIENIKKLKVAIIAGPSSSGKTTATIKISEALAGYNISFVSLNLDNYFRPLEEHPKDEYGDYDFETPHAIDIELVNRHMKELIEGRAVKIPRYDFKKGKRIDDDRELVLKPGQILLIDSLHGLFDEMTASVRAGEKFKIYIEAMCQLKDKNGEFMRWADLRMLRRMVRDSWHRAYDPVMTVGHWHYVRSSEMKHIVPFINKADHVLNSALAYELPVYKKHLYRYFSDIIGKYKSEPKKLDAFVRANRVKNLLEQATEIKDDSLIPGNSLLREFIGGSVYEY